MHLPKNRLLIAIGATLSIGSIPVAAAPIISIKIEDVGSTTNCSTNHNTACTAPVYSSVLDGESGLFRFSTINPGTATHSSYSSWTGDVGTGTIPFLGATGSFSQGFFFPNCCFAPHILDSMSDPTPNPGGAAGDITGGVLTISNLAIGGRYYTWEFDTPPDPGTLFVNWVVPAGPNTYKVSFQWSRLITNEETSYLGSNFRWLIEGTATTTVPVPAAVWLFGSGLAGLTAMARRRRREIA